MAVELGLASQMLVAIHDFTDRVQTAQSGQLDVGQCELNLGHPAFDSRFHPVGHLFGQNVTRVAFKRGAYLRNFVYAFAEMLSDRLSRALIARAMGNDGHDYQL